MESFLILLSILLVEGFDCGVDGGSDQCSCDATPVSRCLQHALVRDAVDVHADDEATALHLRSSVCGKTVSVQCEESASGLTSTRDFDVG